MSADSAEVRLMQSVIINAVLDAVGQNSTAGRQTQRDSDRRAAVAWFTECGPDFQIVCQLAGFDPEWVSTTALKFIDSEEAKPRLLRSHKSRERDPTGVVAIAAHAGVSVSAVRAALSYHKGSKEIQARIRQVRDELHEQHREAA